MNCLSSEGQFFCCWFGLRWTVVDKKLEQPLGCSEKMIVFIVELSENSGCAV